MDEQKNIAQQFEANRARLQAVAHRMLGTHHEAEDAVQETWLRFSRAGTSGVENLGGWLTTVIARVCLDMLRSRRSRREEHLDPEKELNAEDETGSHPERDLLLADSIGLALLVVLETLTPSERVAFVLHDLFDLPFDEIAPIVGRSSAATRQLASRARRRVRGTTSAPDPAQVRQREIVDAFMAASREGDFETLLGILDPDVVLRADAAAVRLGTLAEIRGAAAVANAMKGRAAGAQPALLDGAIGLAALIDGQLRIALKLTIANGRITMIDAIADPERLGQLDLVILDD